MSTHARAGDADYYATLGVAPSATSAEIRHAYREKARRLHPDVNESPDAAEAFAALAKAHDVLADPGRRRAYDLSRRDGARAAGAAGTSRGGSGAATWAGGGVPEAARRRGEPFPPLEPSLRGPDIQQTVHLSLREAAFGTDKTVTVPRYEVCVTCRGTGAAPNATVRQCPRCHGTGRGPHRDEECSRCHGNGGIPSVPCAICNGLGRLKDDAVFPLHFPGEIDDGEVLRIKNEGEPGPQGGPRGDLRLRVAVEPDPILRRRGGEVYADLTISPRRAEEGGAIDVPTLRGSRRLRLPSHVADGATFVLRRQGLRLKSKWRRGDEHVTVHVRAE